ncbi:MAG: hypothetical protein PVH41_03670 [Anaerolineae bacterium]
MSTLNVGRTWRTPYLLPEETRGETDCTAERRVAGRLSFRPLVRLGLILLCMFLIWALILIVPVVSGRLSA